MPPDQGLQMLPVPEVPIHTVWFDQVAFWGVSFEVVLATPCICPLWRRWYCIHWGHYRDQLDNWWWGRRGRAQNPGPCVGMGSCHAWDINEGVPSRCCHEERSRVLHTPTEDHRDIPVEGHLSEDSVGIVHRLSRPPCCPDLHDVQRHSCTQAMAPIP